MIKNECIICFAGEDWWYHNPHSVHHIMQQFAKQNRVMFINSIGLRFPNPTDKTFIYRILNKFKSIIRGPKWVQSNLLVISPIIIPLYNYLVIRWLNKYLLLMQIKLVMQIFRFKSPILYIVMPTATDVVEYLNKKITIYHCVDKIESFGHVCSIVRKMEDWLVRNSDLVFYANRKLYEERKNLNDSTYLITHGVDYTHFSKALNENLSIPFDIKRLKQPIIGYFGKLEPDYIDQKLIYEIANKEPNWSFVFIGPEIGELSLLKKLNNIYFLGKKEYSILPNYASAFNVCILPLNTSNEYYFNNSPIKIREYLATGKPVVSTSFPEIRHFTDVVYVAENIDDFHNCLKGAIHKDNENARNKRIQIVREHTWENKAREISQIIEFKINSKSQIYEANFTKL